MCYPKPGPRCSAHAAAYLQRAELAFNARPFSLELREALEEAKLSYDSTPAGQEELKRRMVQEKEGYYFSKEQYAEYELRLQLGQAKRAEQLAAIKAKDHGDVPHRPVTNDVMFPPEFHRFNDDYADGPFVNYELLKKNDKVIDLAIKDSEQWTKRLNVEELEAASWFTSNGSGAVNAQLLGLENRGSSTAPKRVIDKTIVALDSGIAKSRRETPVKLYRGISDDILEATGCEDDPGKFVGENFTVGGEWSTPVFQSTTLDREVGSSFAQGGVTLEFMAKTAAPVSNISAWGTSEVEYIVPRDQKYRVENIIRYEETLEGSRGQVFRYPRFVVQLVEV